MSDIPQSSAAAAADSEGVLAAEMTDGASSEIARLFREHNSALLRFVAARLGSEQEAREVAQEAYVRVLRLNHPEAVSYLRAFLFKTAANLALDRLRARGRRPPMRALDQSELAVFDLCPERQLAGEQAVDTIRTALSELPRKCREVFLLHRMQGLSRSEIAARVGLRERMVRMYLARALAHVRARLDRAEGREREMRR